MPGSKVLAWAVVAMAALRRRKDNAATRRARADPFRPRPPRGPVPASRSGTNGSGPAAQTAQDTDTGTGNGTPARPGEQAALPTQIPARGWVQVTKRAFKESSVDNVGIMAGGISYAAFLAIFPALIAGISLFGLVADPATIAQQAEGVLAALPQEAQPLIRDQITSLTQTSSSALSISLVVSILLALWTASGGTSSLMTGINVAYDETESRNFLKLRGTALLLTLGGILFVLLTLGLVAVVPVALNALNLGTFVNVIVQVIRWVLLVVLIVVALAVVYRVAPDRGSPQFTWTSVGALVAAGGMKRRAGVVVEEVEGDGRSNLGAVGGIVLRVARVEVLHEHEPVSHHAVRKGKDRARPPRGTFGIRERQDAVENDIRDLDRQASVRIDSVVGRLADPDVLSSDHGER